MAAPPPIYAPLSSYDKYGNPKGEEEWEKVEEKPKSKAKPLTAAQKQAMEAAYKKFIKQYKRAEPLLKKYEKLKRDCTRAWGSFAKARGTSPDALRYTAQLMKKYGRCNKPTIDYLNGDSRSRKGVGY